VGSTVARLRFCEPTPHDLVQADQAPKPVTEQSVAQAAASQARVSAACGHATPPNVGSTVARLQSTAQAKVFGHAPNVTIVKGRRL